MHDPMVVAHEILRPWPQRSGLPAAGRKETRWKIRHQHVHHEDCPELGCTSDQPFPWWRKRSYSRFWRIAGRDWYWPPVITIWHVEPGGHDALTVCQRRVQRPDGTWHRTGHWRWHVHHWRIQVQPLQHLRRQLLTRCAWCGGRQHKGDYVNFSAGWHRDRTPWWRGEAGLFHQYCMDVEHAHRTCFCDDPLLEHGDYGRCAVCGKFRSYGQVPDEAERLLASVPARSPIPAELMPAIKAAWAQRRTARAEREREAS